MQQSSVKNTRVSAQLKRAPTQGARGGGAYSTDEGREVERILEQLSVHVCATHSGEWLSICPALTLAGVWQPGPPVTFE